jgi:hypothetical protein
MSQMPRRGVATVLALSCLAIAACDDGEVGNPTRGASDYPSARPVGSIAPPFSLTAPIPLSARATAALAADLAQRTEHARASAEHPQRMQPVAGTFLVIAGDRGAPFDAAVALTQRVFDALYVDAAPPKTSPLSHRPEKAVEVWVYSNEASYRAGVKAHTLLQMEPPGLGIYEPQSRAIVLRTDAGGTGTLAHEIAHPLIEQDAPRAPVWLNEAIPSLFEVADLSIPNEIHGKAHFRIQTLRDTLASHNEVAKGSIRLDALFGWRTDAFYDEPGVSLRYAVAREAVRWLDGIGKLWPFYHACRDAILEDPTCEASFAKVVGATPEAATAPWLAWVASSAAD